MVGSYPLLSQALTPVEVELGYDNEDQGFEIIKEVPGTMGGAPRMGNPFGAQNLFNNPNLSSLADLMAGGNMGNMSSLLQGAQQGGMGNLINQSSMLQKCK